jgi:hypothetical protein
MRHLPGIYRRAPADFRMSGRAMTVGNFVGPLTDRKNRRLTIPLRKVCEDSSTIAPKLRAHCRRVDVHLPDSCSPPPRRKAPTKANGGSVSRRCTDARIANDMSVSCGGWYDCAPTCHGKDYARIGCAFRSYA